MSNQLTIPTRLQSRNFWLIAVGLVVLVLGVHAWQPFPVTWPAGVFLHHFTVFGALYLAMRWRYEAYLAFSAALGISVVPLVFTGAPLGQWTLQWIGEFSLMTTYVVLLAAVLDYRWRKTLSALMPLWLVVILALCGLLATLGQWVSMDVFPYFHGDNAWWLAQSIAIFSVLLCLTGYYKAAVMLAAVSLGYDWRLLDSHNAWDYVADVFWLPALAIVLWRRWH